MKNRLRENNLLFILIILIISISCQRQDPGLKNINNGKIFLKLGITDNVPYIAQIKLDKNETARVFDKSKGKTLKNWVNKHLFKGRKSWSCNGWVVDEDSIFIKAISTISLGDLYLYYHVDIVKEEAYFRQYYTVENVAGKQIEILEFPVLMSNYELSDNNAHIRWWEALRYRPHEEDISLDTDLILRSKVHSSDDYIQTPGNVPYWYVRDSSQILYHAIAWSGGWQTNIKYAEHGLETKTFLNRMETQLDLQPGEKIMGPELYIFATNETDPLMGRKRWFDARKHLAKQLYPNPEIDIPFIYNHWYAVETNITESFIYDQINPINNYDFDVFVIDDGWYKDVGSWSLDPEKFSKEGFHDALKKLKNHNVTVGLWSCPQLKTVYGENFPSEIDQPGFYVGYMDAWLMDFAGTDFTAHLNNHVDTLTNYLGAGWWKFDQDFFARQSRHGKMKNVNALHEAINEVRRNYPDLVIEACMSGGKMINEFTDMVSQIHWIRDGERSGYMHAISNIQEAMGATEFIEPAKVQRWNNRLDEVDISNTELLKFYLRSCMLGSWGMSTNLSKLDDRYFQIIEAERGHYRRINELKKSNLFQHEIPLEYSGNVYAIYYNEAFNAAAILVYRMFKKEKPVERIIQTALKPGKYNIINVDDNIKMIATGNEISIKVKDSQLSTIYFINKID